MLSFGQRDSRCQGGLVCLMAVYSRTWKLLLFADNFSHVQVWQISDLTSLTLFPNCLKWNLFIVLHTSVMTLPEASCWKLYSGGHFPFLTVVFREECPNYCHFIWDCAFGILEVALQLFRVTFLYGGLPVLSWHNSKITSLLMHLKSFQSIHDLVLLLMLQMVLSGNKLSVLVDHCHRNFLQWSKQSKLNYQNSKLGP